MAVDTRQKRMSMIAFGDGVVMHTLFEADNSVDADDRQHLLGLYSEAATSPPSTLAGVASNRSTMLTLVRGP